jgi:hypothetical protein
MEEHSCLGCGCGCLSTLIPLTILLLLLVCGLIVWVFFGLANGQISLIWERNF